MFDFLFTYLSGILYLFIYSIIYICMVNSMQMYSNFFIKCIYNVYYTYFIYQNGMWYTLCGHSMNYGIRNLYTTHTIFTTINSYCSSLFLFKKRDYNSFSIFIYDKIWKCVFDKLFFNNWIVFLAIVWRLLF